MHVFMTGGAGYVGSAVTRALVAGGHTVSGLARTSNHEHRLRSLGAHAVPGDLGEPDAYETAAASAEAIIHLAAPRGADREAVGRVALDTLLRAAGSGRAAHFIYTSVLFVLGETAAGADEATPPSGPLYAERAALEREVLGASGSGLTTAVIRPGMVYGGGEGGTVSELFRTALTGRVQYIGDGRNRWSLVHRDDVASLFRLIVEEKGTGVFHATDGSPLRVHDVADRVAAEVDGCAGVESIPLDQVRPILGPFADALCLDQPVDSARSRALGWSPQWPSFNEGAARAFAEYQAESAAGGRS